MFEGTNVSEGRGTTKPFETIGAPWMKADLVIKELQHHNFSGVMFRETYFKPTFSKHVNELCHGIQIHITDRTVFEPFKLGVFLVDIIRKMHTEFEFLQPLKEGAHPFIDLLLGTDAIRQNDFNTAEFLANQQVKIDEYAKSIEQYRLY